MAGHGTNEVSTVSGKTSVERLEDLGLASSSPVALEMTALCLKTES